MTTETRPTRRPGTATMLVGGALALLSVVLFLGSVATGEGQAGVVFLLVIALVCVIVGFAQRLLAAVERR